jgi:predicted MFS family arabinose efflux permease
VSHPSTAIDVPHAPAGSDARRGFVPALLGIGLVVSVISSLGAPLIPTIAQEMHASLSATQWSLTATLLVGAVASPLVGRLGDGPHRRTVLLVCLGLVTLGGVTAALAQVLPLLIAGRALQGLGLALMPLTMASARDNLSRPRAETTIATLSVTAAVGVGLGYPITGWIADYVDVSAAFWFGAIASAVAFCAALVYVPASRPATRHHGSLDVVGAVLVGGGVLALLLAVEKGPDWGWAAPATLGLALAAVVLLALWTRNELRVDHPLVELRLVRRRAVLTANVSGLVLGIAMYLGISLVTQIVQLPTGMDESVFVAGLTLLPLSACSLVSSRLMPVVRRFAGPRSIIPIGAAINAVAMLFLALTGDAVWQAFVTMGIVGLGLGFTFAAMPTLIVGSVPRHETSSAMSFYQVTRYVGFSIGSGLAVTLLRAFDGDGTPTADAYSSTLLVGAGLCLVAAAVAWLVPGRALTRPAPADARETDELAIEEGEIGAAGLQRFEGD